MGTAFPDKGTMWAARRACAFRAAALAAIGLLAGCAAYHPAQLARRPDLAPELAGLDRTIASSVPSASTRRIDVSQALTLADVGLLAILNDPDLKSQPGEIGGAQAGLLQATLLPDPAAGFSYGSLITGPGTASAVGGSLAEDIAALVTRGARIASAQAKLHEVDADLLWREWQVAQKARQLAFDIYSGDRAIGLTDDERQLLTREIAAVWAAVAAGNLSLTALSPLLAAVATSEQSLTTLRLDRLKNWQALDGLLGLVPSVRFAIAPPSFPALPADMKPLVASLPERRPDLAALRFGYRSSEANLRAAILGQFPAFTLGAAYGSDTTGVVSAGPSLTLDLPIFDRNQGRIAAARATRQLLRAQYQARLDAAVANIHALIAQRHRLSDDLLRARQAADKAASIATTARRAFAEGNLDERSLTDYETTALERTLQLLSLERQIGEDHIFIAVELGLGLPATRITPGPPRS
jgi:outer membrane protein, heavy metal efflux system